MPTGQSRTPPPGFAPSAVACVVCGEAGPLEPAGVCSDARACLDRRDRQFRAANALDTLMACVAVGHHRTAASILRDLGADAARVSVAMLRRLDATEDRLANAEVLS